MEDIHRLLSTDEKVEKDFFLREHNVHATNKRLFIVKGRDVGDYDYNHISSMTHRHQRYYWMIAMGAILLGTAWFMTTQPLLQGLGWLAWILVILGIIGIIVGIFKKDEWMEITVIGLAQPIRLQGSRVYLDDLFRTVREKKQSPVISPSPKSQPTVEVGALEKKPLEGKFCTNCGISIQQDAKYCSACGKAQLER
jgi:hypothetical protein